MGRRHTADNASLLAEKRIRLQASIDDFHRKAGIYMPEMDLLSSQDNGQSPAGEWEDGDYDSEEDEASYPIPGAFNNDANVDQHAIDETITALSAEQQTIRLPSAFGRDACLMRLRPHAQVELDLRRGQANDALHTIRLHVAEKSFIYGVGVRKGANTTNLGHRGRQKAFSEAHVLEAKIRHQARIYETARQCMEKLGMSTQDREKYPKLMKSDTNASTAVVDFNARGQRNEGLSWIWRTAHTIAHDSAMMSECTWYLIIMTWLQAKPCFSEETVYRVNWLRAKCRSDRWSEELILVKSELEWTRLFYQRKARIWNERAQSLALSQPRLQYYARRQAGVWTLLQSGVENTMNDISKGIK